ncbi:PEP-CTERM sorting domain-containing protein [Paucibacter soli]|uniref:PEP-CTERM sorting domain-containing protein n=1 Tax=Paucibacter soli TaxID=3133433 RepID=UPI0030A14C2A
MSIIVKRTLIGLASATLLAIGTGPVLAQQLIAPDAPVAQLSQSYIAAQFGQWAIKYPADSNPMLDDSGANAAAGDQGAFFFLGGSFTTDPVVRNLTVRTDQSLVINLTSVIDWMGGSLMTEAAIRQEAANVQGVNPMLSLTVDGAPALMPAGFSSLEQFRQHSPLFPLSFGANNIAGVPESVVPAIVDGYLVAMQPLSYGQHQLHVTTLTHGSGPFEGSSFSQDVTYNISAVPEPSTWASLALGLLVVGSLKLRGRGKAN